MEKPNFEQFQKGYVAPATPEAFDARWYKRFEELYFDDYDFLNAPKSVRDAEKQEFLRNPESNPTLKYPKLESFNIEERRQALMDLKHEIIAEEQNECVRKIYCAKINETLAQLGMLEAARNKDDIKFKRYNEFIYGKPEPENLGYVLKSMRARIEKKLKFGDSEQKQAARNLLEVLSKSPKTDDSDMMSAHKLPRIEDDSNPVDSIGEMVHRIYDVLHKEGIYDWDVVVSDSSSFNVSQEKKRINIPAKLVDEDGGITKGTFSRVDFAALVAHEVKTHVVRRHNGERSKLQLLGLGLDRYLGAEEGIATYNQQLIEGGTEFSGLGHYFRIGLATGYFDGTPRTFREVFTLVRDYNIVTAKTLYEPHKKVKDSKLTYAEDRLRKANDAAWTACTRIFRGTTCATPGVVYSKDLAYMDNRKIWTLVSRNSNEVVTFKIGKFDPTRTDHVEVLSQLGILDSELS